MLGASRSHFATFLARNKFSGTAPVILQDSTFVRHFASGDEGSGIKPDNFLKKLQQIGLRELTEITSKYEGLRTDVRSKEEKEAEEEAEEDEVNLKVLCFRSTQTASTTILSVDRFSR